MLGRTQIGADSIENFVIASQLSSWRGNPYPRHPSGCPRPKGVNNPFAKRSFMFLFFFHFKG